MRIISKIFSETVRRFLPSPLFSWPSFNQTNSQIVLRSVKYLLNAKTQEWAIFYIIFMFYLFDRNMPLCMTCKKQYPFGVVYCSVCGKKLVIGILKAKPAPIIIQKETITEVEVIYCRHFGTKNNARLARCAQCSAPIRWTHTRLEFNASLECIVETRLCGSGYYKQLFCYTNILCQTYNVCVN